MTNLTLYAAGSGYKYDFAGVIATNPLRAEERIHKEILLIDENPWIKPAVFIYPCLFRTSIENVAKE
jgi:hypothetical protein